MQWFRVYTDILDDPKIAQMNTKTFKFFIFLCAFVVELNTKGSINIKKDKPIWRFRVRKKVFFDAIRDLIDLNIVTMENGEIYILNWNKRQFRSDDVNERVKRYREKRETLHVTPPDTDTDTETEKNKKKVKPQAVILPDYFCNNSFKKTFEDFRDHRKSIKSKMTLNAEKLLINKLSEFSDNNSDLAIKLMEQSIMNGWKSIFELNERKNLSVSDRKTFTHKEIVEWTKIELITWEDVHNPGKEADTWEFKNQEAYEKMKEMGFKVRRF